MIEQSSDLWSKEEFESHIASTLISLWETRIDPKISKHPDKTLRLTDAELVQARIFGPYIPGKDRRFIQISADNNSDSKAIFSHVIDVANDALPKDACCSQMGSNDLYRQMMYLQKLSSGHYKASYFAFQNKGPTKGFSTLVDIDNYGTLTIPNRPNLQWGMDSETIAFVNALIHTIQAESDRRFCWQIEAKEKLAHAYLGCQSEQVKSLLYARSLPLSSTGRKRPILHLVESHRRRLANGTDIDITSFLRGVREVEMGGTLFKVHAPSNLELK